jgi:hypothetical protein
MAFVQITDKIRYMYSNWQAICLIVHENYNRLSGRFLLFKYDTKLAEGEH